MTGSCCSSPQSLCSKMLRKKSLAEARSMETKLDRCLSIWHLLFYGIAHMAGAGIYVLAGAIVRDTAGPAASISFLVCGLASTFTGLCYVEFATLVPKAGSCYTFTYITLGELPAFVVGWTMVSDYIIAMASVAKAFSGTVDALTNRTISGWVVQHLGRLPVHWAMLDQTWDLVAVALILVLMLLVISGANISLSVNIGLSFAQILCLSLVAVCAFAYGSSSNWFSEGFFPYGLPGVLQGATIAIFAFSGFESITNAAEESRNPRRDLPIALLSCLAIVGVLYVVVTLGLSYLELYTQIDIAAPFVTAFERRGIRWVEFIAAAGTLLATGATKLATMYVIPRMLYALATDGILFRCFGEVNERVKVPLAGLFFGAGVSTVLALLFNIEALADMVSMGVLLSYFAIGLDLLVLRYLPLEDSGEEVKQQEQPDLAPTRPWAESCMQRWPRLRRHSSVRLLIAGFVAASFLAAVSVTGAVALRSWWSCLLLVLPLGAVLLLFVLLCMYRPNTITDCYESPLMPLSPCVTIFVNVMLISRMHFVTWIRFFVWIGVGLILYFTYGMQHSKATVVAVGEYVSLDAKQQEAEPLNEKKEAEVKEEETNPVQPDAKL